MREEMNEIAKLLNPPFSVADGENPKFDYTGDELYLSFIDWHEEEVRVLFKDCVAVKWQNADSTGPEDRDDCTYEIQNSEWLKLHLDQRMVEPEEKHRHFKLCFNAAGVLEVIATEMVLSAQPGA